MGTALQQAPAPASKSFIPLWRNLSAISISTFIWKITFSFHARLRWNGASSVCSLITVDELRAEPASREIFEFAAAREVRLSRVLTAYVVAGRGFGLWPCTFLGFWSMITINSHHTAFTASQAWIQPHGNAHI